MAKNVLYAALLTGLLLLSGCFHLQIDKPLVDLDGQAQISEPVKPGTEQQVIRSLRLQLQRCQAELKKKDKDNKQLKEKLDDCEEQVEKLEDEVKKLHKKR